MAAVRPSSSSTPASSPFGVKLHSAVCHFAHGGSCWHVNKVNALCWSSSPHWSAQAPLRLVGGELLMCTDSQNLVCDLRFKSDLILWVYPNPVCVSYWRAKGLLAESVFPLLASLLWSPTAPLNLHHGWRRRRRVRGMKDSEQGHLRSVASEWIQLSCLFFSPLRLSPGFRSPTLRGHSQSIDGRTKGQTGRPTDRRVGRLAEMKGRWAGGGEGTSEVRGRR